MDCLVYASRLTIIDAALAQLVRALVCGTRGPQFKPERRYHFSVNYQDKVEVGCMTTPPSVSASSWLFPERRLPTILQISVYR